MRSMAGRIADRKTVLELFRYAVVTIVSYLFIVGVIYVLTTYLAASDNLAYLIALTLAYVGIYISFNRYVFKTAHSKKMLIRFLLVLGLSWVGNNLLFTLWTDALSIAYPIATALNTVVLGAFRFLAQKFYVRGESAIRNGA